MHIPHRDWVRSMGDVDNEVGLDTPAWLLGHLHPVGAPTAIHTRGASHQTRLATGTTA